MSAAWIEPDRRHVDLLIQSFGMVNAKSVESLDVKKSADNRLLKPGASCFKGSRIRVPIRRNAGSVSVARQARHWSCCQEPRETAGSAEQGQFDRLEDKFD